MASDSRLTLSTEHKQESKVVQMAVGLSDSNYKTFLVPHNIGITTYGSAEIQGVPIGGYIDSFVIEYLSENPLPIDEIPSILLSYFHRFDPIPATQFHIAGYKFGEGQPEQQVWHVDIAKKRIERLNPSGQQGASWGGEVDILARLIQPVAVLTAEGGIRQVLPHFSIPWQFFTLQDSIDFCIFAIRSTIDAIRFQPRPKTVGGPIDVLVIKPDKAFWVQRKELHGAAIS